MTFPDEAFKEVVSDLQSCYALNHFFFMTAVKDGTMTCA